MDCEEDTAMGHYAIKDVSEMTGVNAVTLRAWQRRYGLLNPMRTEKGHRLYSQDDIDTINDILGWLEKGVAIGKVRPLLDGHSPMSITPVTGTVSDSQKAADQLLIALNDLDAIALDKRLNQLMKEYPVELFEKQIASAVDSAVNHSDNPLANIQAAMWRSVLSERCLTLVAGNRKRNKKTGMLLSFDPIPSYRVWLKAYALANDSYNVTILTSMSGKLTALMALIKCWDNKEIFLDGDNKLDRSVIAQLQPFYTELNCTITLSGSIASIHADIREGQDEPT
ncbi:MerR family transcriptional regulator [Photobacterium japonica]|uniref:MerR family transcriptional regulator n=1 Tax=Photobacterium japonica TaxID=2910235 RepID=UPI003D1403AD